MSNGNGSDRKIPTMPHEADERTIEAWHRSVRAEAKADSVTDHSLEQFGLIMRELGKLNTHTAQLTAVVAEMRDRVDFGDDRPITIPDLERVLAEERKRDSDRVKAGRWRKVTGWVEKGAGKAVSTIVTLAIMAAAGWLARDLLGARSPVHATSAVVAPVGSR